MEQFLIICDQIIWECEDRGLDLQDEHVIKSMFKAVNKELFDLTGVQL